MRNIVGEGLTASEADAILARTDRSCRPPGGGFAVARSHRICGIWVGRRVGGPAMIESAEAIIPQPGTRPGTRYLSDAQDGRGLDRSDSHRSQSGSRAPNRDRANERLYTRLRSSMPPRLRRTTASRRPFSNLCLPTGFAMEPFITIWEMPTSGPASTAGRSRRIARPGLPPA